MQGKSQFTTSYGAPFLLMSLRVFLLKGEQRSTHFDFKLKCLGCEHVILVPREKALKMIKKVVK